MFNRLKSIFYQTFGIDHYDNNFTELVNIKSFTENEKKAAKISRKYPHLKENDIINDLEQGWVRIAD